MTDIAALSIENATVSLGGRPVLVDVNLSLRRGELAAMVGPNGAGKTTLLRALAGLATASGRVMLDGAELARLSLGERARRIAYLPQGHVFHWPMPVADIVALGRLPRTGGAGLSAGDRAAVARAMAVTGIAG